MSLNKDCRRLFALFMLVLLYSNLFAITKADSIHDNSFIRRVSIHTNALDWFMTIPNLGIEYDLLNSEENRPLRHSHERCDAPRASRPTREWER